MPHELWHEVHDFLSHEARLLDERRLDEWLELFTDDVSYRMPVRSTLRRDDPADETTAEGELAFFDEDKTSLGVRVARLATGMAWAEDPPTRSRHVISNLEVEQKNGSSEVMARCAFLLYRTSLEREVELFVGSREDLLRKVDGGWKIARRTVVLDQTVLGAKNLSSFF